MKTKVTTAPEFKTRDLYLAAYIIVQGVPVRGFECPDGRRVDIIFGPEAAPLVEAFRKGGAVAARDYADALRDLKAEMFNAKASL